MRLLGELILPAIAKALRAAGDYTLTFSSGRTSSGGGGDTAFEFDAESGLLETSVSDYLMQIKHGGVPRLAVAPDGGLRVGGGITPVTPDTSYVLIGNPADSVIAVGSANNDKLFAASRASSNITGSRTASLTSNGFAAASGSSTAALQGMNVFIRTDPSSTQSLTATTNGGGMRNRYRIDHQGTGTVTECSPLSAALLTLSAGSVVTTFQAYNVETLAQAGAITNFYGLHMRDQAGGAGTITNQVGVYVDQLSKATNNWAIYVAGTTASYFGGRVDLEVAPRRKEGANKSMGVATLVAGTVTVANTSVTANSRIFLTTNTPGGTVGASYISACVAGTSFTITSTSALDTSTVAWHIVEPF